MGSSKSADNAEIVKVRMMRFFVLANNAVRQKVIEVLGQAPDGWVVEIKPPTRNLEQNSLLWALLTDVSRQVVWHGRRLSPESWKCVFSAAWKKQDVVPGIDGGFVVLGQSTSSLSKREFSELVELIYAFGAEHGVEWSGQAVAA